MAAVSLRPSQRVVAILAFTMTLAAGTEASSECFSAADIQIQSMRARYQNAAVVIDVIGPEPDKCRDVGTGVLMSSAGDILTAKHVVQKPDCSSVGLFARFPWNPAAQVELKVTTYDNYDAAFLQPTNLANWTAVRANYCTAPVADSEGTANESFLRFGRIDLGNKAYGYGGNVVLSAAESGQPPLQLVCTVMRNGDSGGPVLSGTTGKLIGITIKRREKDIYGYPVANQGYIFPAKNLWDVHRQRFDTAAECSSGLIQLASENNLDLDVPYEFAVGVRGQVGSPRPGEPAPGSQQPALTTQIFAPVFGYSFVEIEKTIATAPLGRAVPTAPCSTDGASCVTAELSNNLVTVSARSAPTSAASIDPRPISSVVVYTKQTLGQTGTGRGGEAGDLAHELQGGGAHLVVAGGRLEIEERADVAAHDVISSAASPVLYPNSAPLGRHQCGGLRAKTPACAGAGSAATPRSSKIDDAERRVHSRGIGS